MKIDLEGRKREVEWTWPKDAKQGDDNSVTFILRMMSREQRAIIEDKMGITDEKGRIELRTGTVKKMKLEAAVKGWKNVKDMAGQDIPFSMRTLLDALDAMDNAVETELTKQIDELNNLGVDTEKNS